MSKFSTKSMTKLATCHRDIQTIFMEVVKFYDCTITEGHRTAARQREHWTKGRHLKREGLDPAQRKNWIIADPDKIVTTKDGYEKLSKHQSLPSIAVDVVPYPSMWSDRDKLAELRGVVKFVQDMLLAAGKIDNLVENGADLWNGFDAPHYQLKK